MRSYSVAAWQKLGRAVRQARRRRGLEDMKEWSVAVGRSDRVLLGLERGERVGEKTLSRIEDVLGWPLGRSYQILEGDDFIVTDSGDLLEKYAPGHIIMRPDTHEVLGEVFDAVEPPDEPRDWSKTSDIQLAVWIIEAGDELRRRSIARFHDAMGFEHQRPDRIAAYRPDKRSEYEERIQRHDEAAEAPDAPGSEHGA